ncbi:MAG: Gfo/Idh/MocA family oxidoreductase [Candidatus Omnitrophica bacterium]|nr:Gfo/Idh/MocA family oxidoreductase [Candidatus Omnitrophota bacterium]
MRALFVGLGSIGQRHLINFKHLVGNKAEIFAYRQTNHNLIIREGKAKTCRSLAQYYGFQTCPSLSEAFNVYPDVVFITNPSAYHLAPAIKAASHGCHLFIEKPLSHSLKGVTSLQNIIHRKKLVVMVGYQTRFHPCYQFLEKMISRKRYGRLLSADFEWGTYLPAHHPYEDYRKGYAALNKLGGGVLLGLSHELDMICNLWGQPDELFAVGGQLSPLSMDTEDTVSVLMKYRRHSQSFPVSLFLSYAQTKETRRFKVQMARATILGDFMENTVQVFDQKGNVIIFESFIEFDRNELFISEMKEFVKAVKIKRKPLVDIDDGIESLKLALRIKKKL